MKNNLKKQSDKKGGRAVKTLSLSPAIFLAALEGGALIGVIVAVCAVVAIAVVATVLVIRSKNKKKSGDKADRKLSDKADNVAAVKSLDEHTALQTNAEPIKEDESDAENNVEESDTNEITAAKGASGALTITDADGDITEEVRAIDNFTGLAIVVRYKKSFTARLIQASDETKNYYGVLKNYALGYKKFTSRVSWGYDSINCGRGAVARFVMRGKTLCLYLALDPEKYIDSKYKVEAVESKKYADTPCLYRIKNDLRLKYAQELLDELAAKNEQPKGEAQTVDYYLPYETTEALVEKGLIKELISQENYEQFLLRRSQAEVDKNKRKFVSAAEVNAIIDDDVAATLVEVSGEKGEWSGKKGIINIDELSANFESGESVTLNVLKEKGLVAKNIGYIKVLARGVLDKPLNVEANDYSLQAVKMILLTGGHAKKV